MENNKTEMAIVTQLPIIKNHFDEISKDVSNRLKNVMKLAVTTENLADAKKVRADFNKEFANYEEVRKLIKKEILKPYEEFEKEYKKNITELFNSSDRYLKEQIDFHEQEMKNRKEADLICYFNELTYSENLQDIVKFEDLNIKIGLSDTMNKLRKEVQEKVQYILSDIELILLDEHSNEILAEYKQCFNYQQAKLNVLKRRADAEEIRKKMKELEQDVNVQEIGEVDIIKPQEIIEEELLVTKFEITATLKQLKDLKEYLNENNLKFKNI